VVAAPSASNQTSGGVLNPLQPAYQSIRDAEEKIITVVQSTGDESLDQAIKDCPVCVENNLQAPSCSLNVC